MPGPIRKSADPDGEFTSPFSHGRIDDGYENLKVKLLSWPDEQQFKVMATVAGSGHAGATIDLENFEPDELMVSDAWKGGLGQIKEFGKLVFLITGCSRGFTHEIVRTRIGAAYIQQTMRHTDMGNYDFRLPEAFLSPKDMKQELGVAMLRDLVKQSQQVYRYLVDVDFAYQDARVSCLLGTETWIEVAYDVRSWLDTYAQRRCVMFYPEMVQLMKQMKEVVAEKAPWIAEQAKISCEKPQPDGTHKCTYMGTEEVEGFCDLPWAQEDNRVWKSARFKK